MVNEATLYSESGSTAGMGTAPARGAENMDLGDYVPRTENPLEINRQLNRWLVFAGDVIIPRQKRERPDLKTGGEYFGQQYQTLVRSKGLVRRYQLTPMEIGYDFINSEVLGENTTGLVIAGIAPGSAKDGRPLNAVPVYPGDEIRGIIHRENNAPSGVKGFVEVEVLIGAEYADVVQADYQRRIFPDWDKIVSGYEPVENKLAIARAHFESLLRETSDETFKEILRAYLESCDRYYRWGVDYLKMSAQLVKVPMNAGFAHTYSDQAEMLFEQLDLGREDAIRMVTNSPAPSSGEISNSDVKDLMHQMVQLQQQMFAVTQAGAAAPAPVQEPEAPVVPFSTPQPNHTDIEDDRPVKKEEKPIEQSVVLDGTRCSAISTTTGNQCLQAPVEGSDRCAHPAHAR